MNSHDSGRNKFTEMKTFSLTSMKAIQEKEASQRNHLERRLHTHHRKI